MYIIFIIIIIIFYLLNTFFSFTNIFNEKIVISFTTSPVRITKIKPLIDLLMRQTLKPYKIVINLPYVFKRTNMTFSEIPDFIISNPLIYINWCEDIGPSTKILPTIKLFDDPEQIIISIDDDMHYTDTFIENMVEYSKLHPQAVITNKSFMYKENVDNVQYVELLEGYGSVLYKRKFLDNFDINEILNYPKYCFLADDLILSNHILKNNIPIITNNTVNTIIGQFEYDNGSDALRNGADGNSVSNIDNYVKCSKYLESKNDLHINKKHFANL
jgi:hypothetical protein